jgi:hypothetical protein
MTIEDYLTAFDQWLSQHIYAATKAGKDFAFRDRRLNCALKLDDDGAAWDYVLLDPGASPPPGHAWSIYRLQGVGPSQAPPAPRADRAERATVAGLAEAVFGRGLAKTKGAHLHAVR